MQFFKSHGAKVAAISVDSNSVDSELSAASGGKKSVELDYRLHLPLPLAADPMGLRQNIAVKMMLNAHSTATMTKLDRVLGNTMIYVNPGNLKLIGRATFLIQSHVNDVVSQGRWKKRWQTLYGAANSLSYADANAALFQSMEYVAKTGQEGKLSEVALSIVRILEPLRNDLKATDSKAAEKSPSWDTAKKILSRQSLESYLKEFGQ
jgi:N-acetylmuramic acid 6-phosphate etherase